LSVACHETEDHGNTTQHILDGADVEAGEGTAAGSILRYRHPFLLHDAVGSEIDRPGSNVLMEASVGPAILQCGATCHAGRQSGIGCTETVAAASSTIAIGSNSF
jgi:hypothetical protein